MATDYGPRIRAARGFAGFSQGTLAAKLGREVQWVKRREAGDQEPQAGDLLAIAAATGVPIEFLEHGFTSRVTEDPDLAERVEALESRVHAALGLAKTRDERVATLETQMDELLDIAIGRVGADLGDAAERQEDGEGRTGETGKDRSGPRPEVEGR